MLDKFCDLGPYFFILLFIFTIKLLAYLIVFLYPSKLIKVALPFFLSFPVEFLNNVPMKLTVELGVGDITLRELLQLGHGAVFELDKLAGEPLEVKVNDRLISRGEVVVVNDRYAIRLTDVINPDEVND